MFRQLSINSSDLKFFKVGVEPDHANQNDLCLLQTNRNMLTAEDERLDTGIDLVLGHYFLPLNIRITIRTHIFQTSKN